MKKEETEEQFNNEAKKGWRFAADAASITDEYAGSARGVESLWPSTAIWEH